MVRGINKSAIFSDDKDRQKFLDRLGENVGSAKYATYAWVLMTNHGHLLFKNGDNGISVVMRRHMRLAERGTRHAGTDKPLRNGCNNVPDGYVWFRAREEKHYD